ncbi:hypothetical protein KKH05_00010 [Patescibacteria group bacterium]|nr:hypothetical protein [Patescibacteria group bacterium]
MANKETSPEDKGGHSKVSIAQALFIVFLCLGVDLLELFTSFTGLPLLLSFLDLFLFILIIALFAFKGGRLHGRMFKKRFIANAVAGLAEIIPIIEMLPIRTVIIIWSIWSWNKEVDQDVAKTQDEIAKYAKMAEKVVGRFTKNLGA